MKGRTELLSGGGFEQRLYSDGAATIPSCANQTQLRQHIFGRSGFDLRYDLLTARRAVRPFQFDTFRRPFAQPLPRRGGYLDDKHFQLTRTGSATTFSERSSPAAPFSR